MSSSVPSSEESTQVVPTDITSIYASAQAAFAEYNSVDGDDYDSTDKRMQALMKMQGLSTFGIFTFFLSEDGHFDELSGHELW